ncbi:VacJ family lipoprotein [Methylomonas sp. HYX-M1]|uniref:MlaA family lipoprotein n=1 Tax=Methylomonas sp. HYX-M1 TaxID=3139307 RepID=UPI00345B5CF4
MFTPSCADNRQISMLPVVVCFGASLLAGCASTDTAPSSGNLASEANSVPADPYEGFNRSMYGFNMGLDKYFLKPISDGYRFVTPDFMQTGVTNFFNNLKGINVVLNDVLQGKFSQSASDLGRFTTNSTIGMLGLFDVASDLGFQQNVEDFGQTLAVWGVDQGPYLVLPVLGPTTLRDGGAIIVDKAANPGTYVPGTGIIEGINERANAEGALNFIDEAALDPYVFTRESFLQYRKHLINDGEADASALELDVDAALDEDNGVGDSKKKSNADVDSAPSVQAVPATKAGNDATVEAFEQMSKSVDQALNQFELASDKMDKLGQQAVRKRRR